MVRVALFVVALALTGCDNRALEASAFAGGSRPVAATGIATKSPLRVAYSDWPGWTALEVGIQEGWFKKAGLSVEFSWLDHLPALDAFSAGNVDGVMATNEDALVAGATGAMNKMILLTDYSNGNDKVVARPGIETFRDLKGKKVGLEFTLVGHLLFLKACERNGMKATDVQLVNFATSETPPALTAGEVVAIAAWYPIAGQALRFAPGAKSVFTSADVPGLIYGGLAVNPTSLASRHDDWVKFAKVWYRIVDFVRDPKTRERAVAMMAARAGVKPEQYAAAMLGTYVLSLDETRQRYVKGPGLDSLYGSMSLADDFNVANKVYKTRQPVGEYIDPSVVWSL